MSLLRLESVGHGYEAKRALNGVSFAVEEGQIGCLMGPSGSGKTTALLCIAGLEDIDGGRITLAGRVLSGDGARVPPEARRISMVFQDFALFPHLSAGDNIVFGMRGASAGERKRVLGELLELCDLRPYANSYPHELSGGEQQRVALARALATSPDLLLLDEPFSRLDAALHEKLSAQVRDILKARRQTALLVTHNQYEAFLTADVGGVLNEGAVCQWDDMDSLYHHPRCGFVAAFVGDGALLAGRMESDGGVQSALGRLSGAMMKSSPLIAAGDPVQVLVRPDDVALEDAAGGDAEGNAAGAPALVEQRAFRGATTLYTLRLAGTGEKVMSVCPSHIAYAVGDAVRAVARVRQLILFPALEPAPFAAPAPAAA